MIKMAIAYVENSVMVSYHGITVYHIHKDDQAEQSVREYWYTLDAYGGEDSEDTFDIRDLQGYDECMTHAKNLVHMINDGVFGSANLIDHESTDKNDLYLTEKSKDGTCPVCGTKIEDYSCLEVNDDQGKYPFTCRNCGVSGS